MLFFKFNVFENSYTREGKDLNNKVKHVFILLRDSRNGIFTCKNRRKERKIKLSNLTCEMSFLRVCLTDNNVFEWMQLRIGFRTSAVDFQFFLFFFWVSFGNYFSYFIIRDEKGQGYTVKRKNQRWNRFSFHRLRRRNWEIDRSGKRIIPLPSLSFSSSSFFRMSENTKGKITSKWLF